MRNVVELDSFDVALKADAAAVYGLTFRYTYDPALLVLNSTTFDAAWAGKCAVPPGPALPAGTIAYRCNRTLPDTAWAGGTLVTFNFTRAGTSARAESLQ